MHTNLTPRRDAQVEYLALQKAKCFQGLAGPVAGCMLTPASLGSGIPASPAPRSPDTRTKFAESRVARARAPLAFPRTPYQASRLRRRLSGLCCCAARGFCQSASRPSRSRRATALFRARARGGDARRFRAPRVRAAARAVCPGPGSYSPGLIRRPPTPLCDVVLRSQLLSWRSMDLSKCRGNCGKRQYKRCERSSQ